MRRENQLHSLKEAHMSSIADGLVRIQASAESVPSTPAWFGEVVLIAAHLRKHGVPTKISEQVRFTRRRFGHYEVIDFLAVQIALRHQWRANTGSALRAAPALCSSVHGFV